MSDTKIQDLPDGRLETCTDKCTGRCYVWEHGGGLVSHLHTVASEPYKAPEPIEGELHSAYIQRMAESFEQWANRK